jgi:transcriptional regulator with XRE-family HTH domain
MPAAAVDPSIPVVHSLREVRELRGLSLRRLGARATIDFRRLHLFEHGLRPSPIERRLIAVALRVSVNELE